MSGPFGFRSNNDLVKHCRRVYRTRNFCTWIGWRTPSLQHPAFLNGLSECTSFYSHSAWLKGCSVDVGGSWSSGFHSTNFFTEFKQLQIRILIHNTISSLYDRQGSGPAVDKTPLENTHEIRRRIVNSPGCSLDHHLCGDHVHKCTPVISRNTSSTRRF